MATIKRYFKAKLQPAFKLRWYNPSDGKQKTDYLYCTRKEANQILKEREAEILLLKRSIKTDVYIKPIESITVKEGAEKWIEYLLSNRIAKETLNSYENAIKNLINSIGNIKVNKINQDHRTKFYKYLRNSFADTTNNIRRRNIRAFFNFLVNETKYLDKIPFKMRQIKIPDIDKKPTFITPSDYKKIIDKTEYTMDHPKEFWLNLWEIYYKTGIRLSEIFNIRIDGDWMIVTGKGQKTRIIPIQEDFSENLEIVKPYLNEISKYRISKRFSIQAKKAGLKHTLHHLRHTFCCRMLAKHNGITYKVQMLMGHSQEETTKEYLKFIPLEYIKQIFNNDDINIKKGNIVSNENELYPNQKFI